MKNSGKVFYMEYFPTVFITFEEKDSKICKTISFSFVGNGVFESAIRTNNNEEIIS